MAILYLIILTISQVWLIRMIHFFILFLADTNEKKLKNVELALDLISEAGCKMPKVRASDIVQQDTKSTLRLIYAIYEKFCKGVSSPAWRFLLDQFYFRWFKI